MATSCPRKCEVCVESDHHWIEAMPDPDDRDDHQYVAAAVAAWRADVEANPDTAPVAPIYWLCKHCPEWQPYEGPCINCGETTDDPERVCDGCAVDPDDEWDR